MFTVEENIHKVDIFHFSSSHRMMQSYYFLVQSQIWFKLIMKRFPIDSKHVSVLWMSLLLVALFFFSVFCPFPGFIENGKVLLVGSVGLYEYRPYVRKIRNNRQIMFQCTRGFILVGGPTGATCIDGSWSPPQLPR